jgi:hypothetical protein
MGFHCWIENPIDLCLVTYIRTTRIHMFADLSPDSSSNSLPVGWWVPTTIAYEFLRHPNLADAGSPARQQFQFPPVEWANSDCNTSS